MGNIVETPKIRVTLEAESAVTPYFDLPVIVEAGGTPPGPGPVDPDTSLYLYSVGSDDSGQLGIGTVTFLEKNTIQLMDANKTWPFLQGGGASAVYTIKNNGELWACGWNGVGQLDGIADPSVNLTKIGVATNWDFATLGDQQGYMINTLGELWATGGNDQGQLGQGTTDAGTTTPVQIESATNWVLAESGRRTGYFINSLGELWAVGFNGSGQLGQGDVVTPVTSIVQIGAATNWVSMSSYWDSSYFINDLGEAWACGKNADGQLGQGNTTSPITSLVQIGNATNWVQIEASIGSVHLINDIGEIWACGLNDQGQLGQGFTGPVITSLTKISGTTDKWIKVTCGDRFAAFINDSGEVWGVGANESGQLAQGDFATPKLNLVQIGSDQDWADISGGGTNLYLRKDTTV